MFMKFKNILFIFFCFTITSSWCQDNKNDSLSTDGKLDDKYLNSLKLFKGKLDKEEYKNIKIRIENELNIKIPDGKDILINYSQKAPNCFIKGYSNEVVMQSIDRTIEISSRICEENNAIDFFVFSEDSFFKDFYETKKEFSLDSGFFYKNIFNLHEYCSAFFILKANGKFYKYYGDDYFSEVKKYL